MAPSYQTGPRKDLSRACACLCLLMSPLPAFVTTKAWLQPQMSLYLSRTPWMSSNISQEGIFPEHGFQALEDLLVRTCLGNQPQGCQLSDGRRGDRECLGLLHWKPVENLGTA